MTSNGHEDKLLADLTWSDDSYALAEFVTEFPLPQVVKVVRGHDGGLDGATLGYGEVLTIHALRESRVLFAYDKDRNPISITNNHPDEFQILPQTKDCALKSCGVEDIPSFYQAVKYLEVIEAHYGIRDDVDSVDFGELLQILDMSKANKADKMRVNVRNLETGRTYVLTSKCSARFRPLLDWKKYKAPELKTHQFGLPVRVRFKEVDDGEATVEYQRFVSENPDINIINEINDIVVMTTTVSSDPALKFCFEIPKDIEIKIAVAEGFDDGAKLYTAIVNSLNERFDVAKFMADNQPSAIKRRDVIKQHNYDTIRRYIIDKIDQSIKSPKCVEPDTNAPALLPRKPKSTGSQSFDFESKNPPMPPERPKPTPALQSTRPPRLQKPPVPLRRSVSQREASSAVSTLRESPCEGKEDLQLGGIKTSVNDSNMPYHSDDHSHVHVENSKKPFKLPQDIRQFPPHAAQPTEDDSGDKVPAETVPVEMPSSNIPTSLSGSQQGDVPNLPPLAERKHNTSPLHPNLPQRIRSVPDKYGRDISKYPKIPKNIPVPHENVPETANFGADNALRAELENIMAKKREKKEPVPLPPSSQQCRPSNGEEMLIRSPPQPQSTSPLPSDKIGDIPCKDISKPKLITNISESIYVSNTFAFDKPPGTSVPKCPTQTKASAVPGTQQQTCLAENKNQADLVKDEEETDTFVPEIPPKSPELQKRIFAGEHMRSDSNHKSRPPGMLPKKSPKWPQGRHPEAVCESPLTPTHENPAFEPPVMTVVPRVNPETPQAVEIENPYALVSDIPLDLSALSVTEVSDLLKNLNMGQYAKSFEDEMIDGSLLKELKDSDLQSFQMTTLHRTKLLNFIKGWRPRLNRN